MSADVPEPVAPCPVVVSVNIDAESQDAPAAGEAGLLGRYSYGRYGTREGIWRLLRVLRDHSVPATMFLDAGDAARHPKLVAAIRDEGHEIAAQGIAVADASPKGPADRDGLARDKEALAAAAGVEPSGWRATNGLVTADTLQTLVALGYRYDSSFQDDDVPYVFDVGGARLAELPVFDYLTDATFYRGRHGPDRVRKAWMEEFDALYGAGGYIHLTLHSRGDSGSARAVRAHLVGDFLSYVASRPGVRFYRAGELAEALVAGGAPAEPVPDWNLSGR